MKSYVPLQIPKLWSSKHVKSLLKFMFSKKYLVKKKLIEIPSR